MSSPVIGIVGPCAAGKTTLVQKLRTLGYSVRHIAQEHSYVPDMWRRIANPDLLVYLDVGYPNTLKRRKLNWNESEYQEQVRRLQHAQQHADLVIATDALTPDEVLHLLISWFLAQHFEAPGSE